MRVIAAGKLMETNIMIHHLSAIPVGGDVSYAVMSGWIGKDVQKPVGRSILYSARTWLEREKNVVFGTVPRTGIKRLDPNETVDLAVGYVKRASTASKRAEKLAGIATTAEGDLSPDARTRRDHIWRVSALLNQVKQITGG